MNGLRQLRDATGVGWRSPTVDDNETASQQHGEESQTSIEVQCRAELGVQGPPVWNWCAHEHEASKVIYDSKLQAVKPMSNALSHKGWCIYLYPVRSY